MPSSRPFSPCLRRYFLAFAAAALHLFALTVQFTQAQYLWPGDYREYRSLEFHDPPAVNHAPLPYSPAPATVSASSEAAPISLALDDAIRLALENATVVRVLAGVSAASSGRTIYDPAIVATQIENEQARFDPTLTVNNDFNRIETPQGILDPMAPAGAVIDSARRDDYRLQAELAKTLSSGGNLAAVAASNPSVTQNALLPLNPQHPYSFHVQLSQPLLQGGGFRVNAAGIVVARIETERSYFQLKESVQGLVANVIEAYWLLVAARVEVWAREQQVTQGQMAFERAAARQRAGLADLAEVSQARLAFANFRASLVVARANVLDREAALRNLLGLPAATPQPITPLTPPANARYSPHWPELVALAEERRPDLIELKLVLEADQERLLVANNQALPRLDAVALYRWNGLEGETPSGDVLSTHGGQFTDWTLGVNFSVPLGLRRERAGLRQQELIIARDEAHLQQGLHAAAHALAGSVRRLDQDFEQYQAFHETRQAAEQNLGQQIAEYRAGRTILLNVLQAITDWGNSVSSEAQSLAQYNASLARLERETGTILETHGVRFYEERFASIGPLGRLFARQCYPERLPPTGNADRYPRGSEPAENFFQLRSPLAQPRP